MNIHSIDCVVSKVMVGLTALSRLKHCFSPNGGNICEVDHKIEEKIRLSTYPL